VKPATPLITLPAIGVNITINEKQISDTFLIFAARLDSPLPIPFEPHPNPMLRALAVASVDTTRWP
jgi:hypothetical protein